MPLSARLICINCFHFCYMNLGTEKYRLDRDIQIICITASSFPEGVSAAHQKLHSLLPIDGRKFYGISHPDRNGNIIYKAAAEEMHSDEGGKLGLETFTIKKGIFTSELLHD